MNEINNSINNIPIVALRGLVVFPRMILHFDVGREKSINAIKYAMEKSKMIFLVSQKNITCDNPMEEDLNRVGVFAEIKQMIKIPNSNNMRVVVEGGERAFLMHLESMTPYLSGTVIECHSSEPTAKQKAKEDGYIRNAKKLFEEYSSIVPKIPSDVIVNVLACDNADELSDLIASNTSFSYQTKQLVLEELKPIKRISLLCTELSKELKALNIELEIQEKLQKRVEENQREYYLREEMKVIADELGDGEDNFEERDKYVAKIKKLAVCDEIKEKLLKEADRLFKMPSGSHEGTVVRTYLDTCLEIPFGVYSKENYDTKRARKILDKDHYGLDKVKQRIVESIAVRKLAPDINGQIICLAGPPGVGKTSIAKSLAKALGREYQRVSLGGVHDESDIRGHRKTYIGSMPGRIISAVKNSKVMNPLILLDEIDKLGFDVKGDPASALLEALDPEQNNTFTDHFIDFPVDLSKVMFITTANDLSTVPEPLLDRMEVIELGSYTHNEKFNIAKQHLVKKQMVRHGLDAKHFKITNEALDILIENYTKEAGVRNLEREIANACRKAAMTIVNDENAKFSLTKKNIEEVLGAPKYKNDIVQEKNEIGVVNGLAWTRVGGTMLPIEIASLDGDGKIQMTGSLGDVMVESAKTAVSYIRSKTQLFGVNPDFYKKKDIHIHAPESAIPKDGPSAGIAITSAIISELTSSPIDSTIAMTGEISLKGKVLPIGGLREKTMAAYRAGMKTVIFPFDNISDLDEVDREVKKSLNFVPVKNYEEVANVIFGKKAGKGHISAKILPKEIEQNNVITQ